MLLSPDLYPTKRRSGVTRKVGKRRSHIYESSPSRNNCSSFQAKSRLQRSRRRRRGQALHPAALLHGSATGFFDFAMLRMRIAVPRRNSQRKIPPDSAENNFATVRKASDDEPATLAAAQRT